jgi:hypothetical protein
MGSTSPYRQPINIDTDRVKEGNMWIEYVREGLKNGQQVFRRSVVENLIAEIEQISTSQGDSAEVAALKRELAITKKQYRDLNIRFHQVKAGKLDVEQDAHTIP